MVITNSRPPSSGDHAVEMLHMPNQKRQGGRRTSEEMASTKRKEHVPSPLRPPPPLHRLHSTAVAVVGTSTPPLAFSPGKACRRLSHDNQQPQAQAKQQQQQQQQQQQRQQQHAPIISWGGKSSQSAAMAADSATAATDDGSRIVREVDVEEPLPWPPTLSPLQLQPRPSHPHQNQHQHQLHLPNPSFGDEDFGMLAGCIENLDSMGSIDDNSVVFPDTIRQDEKRQVTATSCMNTETEKMMAADGAMGVIMDSSGHGQSYAHAETYQSRSMAVMTEKDAVSMHLTNDTKIMTPPSEAATDEDFMRQSHSLASVVVTSPSRNGDSNCSRSTVSHPPSSPEAFLLITPAGMSGASSPSSHQHMHLHETSPTSLHWDEDYSNMDQFFNDMTDAGTMTSYLSAGGSGGQEYIGAVSSRNNGLDNVTAEACVDSSGGNCVQFSPVKRRECDVLHDCRSPLVDDDGREQKNVTTQHQVQQEASSNLTSTNSSPFSLRNVMNLSSTRVNPELKATKDKKSKKKDTKLKKNKNRKSPVKSTKLLTPRDQSSSLTQSPSSRPAATAAAAASSLPSQPQLFQENDQSETERVEIDWCNDPMHPSKATFEQYDNELYTKLRNTNPPREMSLPPSLVPSAVMGNRLVILQGSLKQHKQYEIEDCVMQSSFAFYQFLHGIYPALEGCTYLLPGLHRRKTNDPYSCRWENVKDGIDWRRKIHVSSFGSFNVGQMPGMTRSDKSKLTKAGLKMAKQRVECAIYAFGGTVLRRRKPSLTSSNKQDKMSIFRVKQDLSSTIQSSSSSMGRGCEDGDGAATSKSPQRSTSRSTSRKRNYEDKLRQQYFEHGDRLSWDVQANLSLTLDGGNTFDEDDGILLQWSDGSNLSDGLHEDHHQQQQQQQQLQQQKQKKNKCKKCGQIKQGHVCPYSSSMQRNIGIMVYPCVNAHVADEPGYLAPALCEMNNFISIKGSASFESINGDDKMLKLTSLISSEQMNEVTQVRMSTSCGTDAAARTMNLYRRKTLLESSPTIINSEANDSKQATDAVEVCCGNSETESSDLLFQPAMEITIDQYRSITPKNEFNTSDHDVDEVYMYPQVPLTFTQRKSLSDALFSLSKRVPKLTEECALVLTEARKNDQWDLAVAELMTQVLCVLHCSPTNDFTLGGLRQYLLTLGIVC